ncbi:hypothetical protein B4589_013210 [Halolamina sp. CBA1230]|uniref:hypothetical protein n=1 Tax=Halolamina sp. CBA1230 TaxID=1853690 RepID=UPI0009A16B92|nr:hypothetical protein [Halolamina sp. CBA1230]QKY21283.1 hypothetical protein B4589_013210 [Halolamina sp. CBA1230]
MSSTNGDAGEAGLDPETESAVRRIVREERDSPLWAIMQVLGGALFAILVVPAVLGLLLVVGVPFVVVAGLALVGLLGAIAYGWALPPFR